MCNDSGLRSRKPDTVNNYWDERQKANIERVRFIFFIISSTFSVSNTTHNTHNTTTHAFSFDLTSPSPRCILSVVHLSAARTTLSTAIHPPRSRAARRKTADVLEQTATSSCRICGPYSAAHTLVGYNESSENVRQCLHSGKAVQGEKWDNYVGLFLGQQVQAWFQACLSQLNTNMSDISPPVCVCVCVRISLSSAAG